MAGSPQWKVYDAEGNYLGCAKLLVHCATMLSIESKGATIRFGHGVKQIVYMVGSDGEPGEIYDKVVRIALERREEQKARIDGKHRRGV